MPDMSRCAALPPKGSRVRDTRKDGHGLGMVEEIFAPNDIFTGRPAADAFRFRVKWDVRTWLHPKHLEVTE